MRDYSLNANDSFSGLKWSQVLALLAVLENAEYTNADHIRRRYLESAQNFEETLAFLSSVAGVSLAESNTIESSLQSFPDEAKTQSWILSCLLNSDNAYRNDIYLYLQKFHIEDGEPRYHPELSTRHYESNIRNFLIEFGIVSHNADGDYYYITPGHIDLYVAAQDSERRRLSLSSRASMQADRELLGTAAEELILEYERERVGVEYQQEVQHIAVVDTAAGYDIKSVTLEQSGRHIPRYIEVKAVPRISLRFYWTRNEVLTSQKFGEWYYLYLLPVGGNGQFIMEELTIVQNPATNVLVQLDRWEVEPEVLQCIKRPCRERGHSDVT